MVISSYKLSLPFLLCRPLFSWPGPLLICWLSQVTLENKTRYIKMIFLLLLLLWHWFFQPNWRNFLSSDMHKERGGWTVSGCSSVFGPLIVMWRWRDLPFPTTASMIGQKFSPPSLECDPVSSVPRLDSVCPSELCTCVWDITQSEVLLEALLCVELGVCDVGPQLLFRWWERYDYITQNWTGI